MASPPGGHVLDGVGLGRCFPVVCRSPDGQVKTQRSLVIPADGLDKEIYFCTRQQMTSFPSIVPFPWVTNGHSRDWWT